MQCYGLRESVRITRRYLFAAIATIATAKSASASGDNRPTRRRNRAMTITRVGSQPSSKGSAEYFTGSVRIDPLFRNPEPSEVNGGLVTFEPDARTHWHTHPRGQTLIVVSGVGWAQ